MKAIKPQSSRLCAQTRCVPILVCSGNTQRTCNVNNMYISIAVFVYCGIWEFVNLHLKLALVLLEQVSQVSRVWDALLKIFGEKAAKKIIKIDVNECILQKIWFWIYILNRAYISWVHLIKVATKFIVVQSWSFSSYLIKEKTYKVIPIFAQYWV